MESMFLKYCFKVSIAMVFLFFLNTTASAQEQKVADSLVKIYNSNNFMNNSEKLELLRNLSFNEVNSSALGLQYAEELIALSKVEKNYLYLHRGYHQKGNKLSFTGD